MHGLSHTVRFQDIFVQKIGKISVDPGDINELFWTCKSSLLSGLLISSYSVIELVSIKSLTRSPVVWKMNFMGQIFNVCKNYPLWSAVGWRERVEQKNYHMEINQNIR